MAYSGIQNWLSEELKTIQESGLWKNEKLIKGSQGSDVKTSQGDMINFCANNYLGLADNEEIKKSVIQDIRSPIAKCSILSPKHLLTIFTCSSPSSECAFNCCNFSLN